MNTHRLSIPALIALLSITTGCGYLGSARPIEPAAFDKEPGWVAVRNLQFERQTADNDCGAASVAMVLTHWRLPSTSEDVLAGCPATKEGMRAGELRDYIRKRGLKGFLIHGTLEDLKTELAARRPVIVGLVKPYVNGGLAHYEVVMGINPERKRVATFDPAKGPRQNSFEGFLQEWKPSGSLTIVVLGTEASSGSRLPPSSLKPPSLRLEAGGWELEAATSRNSRACEGMYADSAFPAKTAWLEAGSWELEAANSKNSRACEVMYAGGPLTPLMAAPHPDGHFPFPSGCRRHSFARHAGEGGVSSYIDNGWTPPQEERRARFDP